MYTLGIDIGSSFVKAALLHLPTGKCVARTVSPKQEMAITAPRPGRAEQNPVLWWTNIRQAISCLCTNTSISSKQISAIGIAYQMHGLVMVDKNGVVLRPAIIWCDSRAVACGESALTELGKKKCLSSFLNAPGNFTASKLKWVRENEPECYEKAFKIMLPGDYIAYKMTDIMSTTIPGLSEGILWNFRTDKPAYSLLDYYGISADLLPALTDTFGDQGRLSRDASAVLGLPAGIPVSYRAGDQPNNAFSLNVLQNGEVAATAGTSGVVYAVSDSLKYHSDSVVNTFAHVNYKTGKPRLGILLCINGAGSMNSWLRKNLCSGLSYRQMDMLASEVAPGSDGLQIFPFGNGAERMLHHRDLGASLQQLRFNNHTRSHLLRAAQEGIAFSFKYGMESMLKSGVKPIVIRAANANMFRSAVFSQTLADITGINIELYDTDGAVGAAGGAAVGIGFYGSPEECFTKLRNIKDYRPDVQIKQRLKIEYERWEKKLRELQK